MTFSKIVLLVVSLLLLNQGVFGNDHNIVSCPNASEPRELIKEVEVHETGLFLGIRTKIVRVPESGILIDPITCVLVTDLDNDGTGGYPTITSGGVASNYVEIKLVSQLGRGLNFEIEVYKKGT